MINIIIDRVGGVNVCNVIDDEGGSDSHLQSTMDDDLILEYIKEVENLINISNTLQNSLQNQNSILKSDVLHELKVIGQTFFEQFFPGKIAEKLRQTSNKYLHLNIDPRLSEIPWELLHNGTCFLSDKFCIGKNIFEEKLYQPNRAKEKLKMLIIADPTETLKWAQIEGDELFQILSKKVPSSRLEIEFIGGKQVTKLKLLSLIRGKNIIHFTGHLFFSDDPLENGWLLADNKIIKAREIKNSGFSTDLVFSNSCEANRRTDCELNANIMNHFAGSFLMSGIKCFIGSNWKIVDNMTTIDFTIRFYTYLFSDKSIGEALYLAKEYARRNYNPNDLTWANYSLHGYPNYQIISDPKNVNRNLQKIINPSAIFNFYPTNIAKSYQNFLTIQKDDENLTNQFIALITAFEEFSKIAGSIIFSDHINHSLGKYIPNNPDDSLSLEDWWTLIYACMQDFKKLEISILFKNLGKVLENNYTIITKIINWIHLFRTRKIEPEATTGYLITMQYYYENIMAKLEDFEKCSIFYIPDDSTSQYLFKGINPSMTLISAPMMKQDSLTEQIKKHRGKLVVFHESQKILITLYNYIKKIENSEEYEINFPGFNSLHFTKEEV